MNLEEIKLYLRIDTDEDDDFLLSLQNAAEEYLKNAGVRKNYESGLYKTAVKKIISSLYEQRDIVGGKDTLSTMFLSIVSQLTYVGGGEEDK